MHIDQARVLKSALDQAIKEAEQSGSQEVALTETLDGALGDALQKAQEALDAGTGG